jgi:hypothetical protein
MLAPKTAVGMIGGRIIIHKESHHVQRNGADTAM